MATRSSDRTTRVVMGLLVLALVVGLGVVVPLRSGEDPRGVAAVLVGGLLAGAPTLLFPLRRRLVVALLALFGGLAVVLALDPGLAATWLFGFAFGGLVGADLVTWLRPAPPARQAASAPGVRLVRDGADGAESVDVLGTSTRVAAAKIPLALDAVRALDGRSRTTVTLFRGARGRLDVGGDAAGAMVVFQSDDRRRWHQVMSAAPHDERVEVVVGAMPGSYPRDETTDLAGALTAVETYLRSGVRAEELTWRAESRGREVVRPPSLEATD